MRIAVVSAPFVPVPPPRHGGTEQIIANLVSELSARGHEVTLYATGDSRAAGEVRSHFDAAVWPPNPYRELAHTAQTVYELLSGKRQVDIVHAHTPSMLAFARMLDLPIVYTVHHERDEALTDLYRVTQGSSVTMISVSERQRELSLDVFPSDVVYSGLDTKKYKEGDGRGGYAAFVGRFAREKGAHVAIDAALRAGLPIRIAGQPQFKDEAYYRAEVETRLRKKGVTWLGEMSHEPKVSMLGGAVAMLAPVQWEQPFGLAMVESMLCGTPVIAFGRGAVPELVEDGVTGFIVRDTDEMAQKLMRLASGKERFDRARCRARAATRFSAERMADDYLAIYTMAVHGLNKRGLSAVSSAVL